MNIVGLIPARGGSKKIPKKNIIDLNGIPLIAHTIKPAMKSSFSENVFISTDDDEIANIAKEYGAKIPFIRPKELSGDSTPDRPVLLHFIEWYENEFSTSIDLLIFLRPTSPFRTPELIDEVLKKIIDINDASSLRTVTQSEGVFHPFWNYKNENGFLKSFCNIDISNYYQKQLLPECYRLNGFIDILRPEIIKSNKNIYGDKITFYPIEERISVDIDTEFDLLFARYLMKNMK